MIFKREETKEVQMAVGLNRRVLAHGDGVMIVEVTFDKGAVGALHKHFHEQISYILQGSFEYTLGDETKVVLAGDSCYIPSNVEHGVKALENGKILDVFSPQREDFL